MWQRVQRLRFGDGLLVGYALVVSVQVRIALALWPWPRLIKLAGQPRSARAPRYTVDTLERAVQRTCRALPGSTCLARALLTQRLLSRYGYESVVHIGVRRDGRTFLAHAWVECGRTCLPADDREIVRYTPLTTWPRSLPDPRR